MTLPPDIPQARFWSLTLSDNQTAVDARDAAAVPAGGKPVIPDAGGGGERRRLDTVHVGPDSPPCCRRQLDPDDAGQGYFAIRLHSPLATFFDKSWRVGEFEPA